jgi:hypothetical protein
MTADALVIDRLLHQTGVIAEAGLNAVKNFRVALQALEALVSTAKSVAGGTLCGPA